MIHINEIACGRLSDKIISTANGADWYEFFFLDKCYVKHTMYHRNQLPLIKQVHNHFEEKWHVIAGEGYYYYESRKIMIHEGDTIIIPPGVYHVNPFNTNYAKPLVVVYEVKTDEHKTFFEEFLGVMNIQTSDGLEGVPVVHYRKQLKRFNQRLKGVSEIQIMHNEGVIDYVGAFKRKILRLLNT